MTSGTEKVKGKTRLAILDIAENLLQRLGYNGFSYQHISNALGIKKAAIHYHFASKSDLGLALIRRFRQRSEEMRERLSAEQAAPDVRLDAYLDIMEAYLKADCKLCPGGVLGAAFDTLPAVMQQETRALMVDLHDWLAGVLEDGRQQGYFLFAGDSRDKALTIGSALQGALQVARATSADRYYRVVAQLRCEILVPAADRPRAAVAAS